MSFFLKFDSTFNGYIASLAFKFEGVFLPGASAPLPGVTAEPVIVVPTNTVLVGQTFGCAVYPANGYDGTPLTIGYAATVSPPSDSPWIWFQLEYICTYTGVHWGSITSPAITIVASHTDSAAISATASGSTVTLTLVSS